MNKRECRIHWIVNTILFAATMTCLFVGSDLVAEGGWRSGALWCVAAVAALSLLVSRLSKD